MDDNPVKTLIYKYRQAAKKPCEKFHRSSVPGFCFVNSIISRRADGIKILNNLGQASGNNQSKALQMNKKALTEADICTKFITPALVGANGDKWDQTRIAEERYFPKGRVIVCGKRLPWSLSSNKSAGRSVMRPEKGVQPSVRVELAGSAGLRTRSSSSASAEPRDPKVEPRGWHSRGYMPHFDSRNVIQHVTFHLADSLAKEAVERILAEIESLDPERRDIEKRRRLEALVDAGHGSCWLRRPDCARIVQDALLHFDGDRYRMIAWVVMPNHVHTLFQTGNGRSMNAVVGSWKTFTANAIGRIVRQPDAAVPHVWHPEFWDRFIRDANHFASALAYIHNNPVKAGLVSHPEDWPWSSAGNAGLRTRSLMDASTEPRDPRKGNP